MKNRRWLLIRSILLSIVFVFACVWMYFDAENARLPIFGNSPPATRIFAVLGGVFFLGMAFYAFSQLPHEAKPTEASNNSNKSVAQAPIERAEQRFSSMLPAHGIREGHVPTVDEIEQLVQVLDAPLSPMGVFAEQGLSVQFSDGQSPDDFWGPWTDAGDDMDYAELWVDRAPPEALDSLLKFLDTNGSKMDAHDEDANGLAMLLGEWVRQHPERWVQEMGARLNQPELRGWALTAFSWAGREESLPFLEPWVPRVNELSVPEAASLISALGEIGTPHAFSLLRQVKSSLQNPSEEALEELNIYLAER